jgi:hypothetical protein
MSVITPHAISVGLHTEVPQNVPVVTVSGGLHMIPVEHVTTLEYGYIVSYMPINKILIL